MVLFVQPIKNPLWLRAIPKGNACKTRHTVFYPSIACVRPRGNSRGAGRGAGVGGRGGGKDMGWGPESRVGHM